MQAPVTNVTVKFLKKVLVFDKNVWQNLKEIDTMNRSKVIYTIQKPQMDWRGGITFTNVLKLHM